MEIIQIEITTGQNVIYYFPEAAGSEKSIKGRVIEIAETFIKIATEQNTVLKVSEKNFRNIETE